MDLKYTRPERLRVSETNLDPCCPISDPKLLPVHKSC
ncbi:hypothetical protein AVEN_56331-1, partial [Araneus ventricosus]